MASPVHRAFLASVLASAMASHACVAITQVVEELYGDSGKRLDTNLIRIEEQKVRIDLGRLPDTYQIYRGDLAVLWTVDLKAKTYLQRTGQDAEAMRAEWNEGMARMREQAEALPPGPRKEMQDKADKLAAAARTTYRRTGDGGKVGGWPTVHYAGYRKDEKVVEEWVAEARNLGIPEAGARALRDKDGYFDKYSGGWPGRDLERGNGPVGVTVRSISFRDGAPMWRTEFLGVRKDTCADGLFEIPPGLALRAVAKE